MKTQTIEMTNVKHEIVDSKGKKSLVITIDLEQCKRTDLPLTSKGRSYQVATSNGFRLLENVPGFENVAFSVNTIVDKQAYEAYVSAQATPAPVQATSSVEVDALKAMVVAQQQQMAQMQAMMQQMLSLQVK